MKRRLMNSVPELTFFRFMSKLCFLMRHPLASLSFKHIISDVRNLWVRAEFQTGI